MLAAPPQGTFRLHRQNNLDALRLVAAASVIFSHSFLLAEGTQTKEPLWAATGGQCVLGVVGVFVFFVISGYLITQSFEQTRGAGRFVTKRALRIFPGLAGCIAVCGFVVGPLVTTLPLEEYFASPLLYRFVAGNLVLDVEQNRLPGVAFSPYDVGGIVDGPLWSLPCEVLMYALVLVLGLMRLLRTKLIVALILLGMAAIWGDVSRTGLLGSDLLGSTAWLLAFFAVGMAIYRLGDRCPWDWRLAVAAALGLVAAAQLGVFILCFPLLGGYLTLYLGFCRRLPVMPAARYGDLSYGLYIYGWPIQQLVVWWGDASLAWWQVFALALPITAAVAFLSWHVVEAPALALKPGRAARAAAPATIPAGAD
jgi:peptidoglycan/LPS O-acetylase OafA/YrhL